MSVFPYRHVTDHCFASAVGPTGLTEAEFRPVLAETAPALEQLRAWHDDGNHPFLTLPARRDDLAVIEAAAVRFREGFDSVVVLGTGGSSLGGRTLTALVQPAFGTRGENARVHFMENVDGASFEGLFRGLDLRRTGFVVISKSGRTTETLAQFLICLAAMREAVDLDRLNRHFLAIVEPGNNPLRRLAEHRKIPIIDHDPKLGGRFSALSVTGLLPAVIAELDAAAAREGASAVLEQTLSAKNPADSHPAVGAALNLAFHRHRNAGTTVVMPYSDRLAPFGLWFRQLWAESLGKDGKGTTPIRALGSVDQHSQLQLYLAGPSDKFYTFITTDCAGTGQVIAPDRTLDAELDWLVGRTMGDVMYTLQRSTWKTLVQRGRPVRQFRLPVLDARALGAMMMHYMLETAIAAHLFGVDPFDQPAVERGKVLARRYLQRIPPR